LVSLCRCHHAERVICDRRSGIVEPDMGNACTEPTLTAGRTGIGVRHFRARRGTGGCWCLAPGALAEAPSRGDVPATIRPSSAVERPSRANGVSAIAAKFHFRIALVSLARQTLERAERGGATWPHDLIETIRLARTAVVPVIEVPAPPSPRAPHHGSEAGWGLRGRASSIPQSPHAAALLAPASHASHPTPRRVPLTRVHHVPRLAQALRAKLRAEICPRRRATRAGRACRAGSGTAAQHRPFLGDSLKKMPHCHPLMIGAKALRSVRTSARTCTI
jgi:hypothetical protein